MACALEEREMEVEALQSIYEKQFRAVADDEPAVYEVDLIDSNTKITFTLPEDYPNDIPLISVTQDNRPVTELESHLHNTAQQSLGDAMIYDLVEEAKEWIGKFKLTNQISSSQEESKSDNDVTSICKFFLEGKCKFGSKCFNKHGEVTSTRSPISDGSLQLKAGSGENVTSSDVKQAKETHNLDGGSHQRKLDEGSRKKPPMKTAGDVISRIKWDEELSPKYFQVGYLDRFVGIIEKSFTEFSWEDLASVDHFVDLAIPRHRIQYFKYQGEVVWDKRDRTDKVFGSTGDKQTIMDVIERARAREERGEKGAGPDNESESVTEDSCHVVHIAEDFSKLERTGPNYFIAVQVTDSGVLTSISKLQNAIQAELDPGANYELIPGQRLHITLLMLTLHNEDEITNAKNILKSVQPAMVSILPPTHKLRFTGLGVFHERIIYATVEPDARLSKLVHILKYKFAKAGISLEGNRSVFVPHVSILRSAKNVNSTEQVRENFTKVVNSYRDYEIGEQGIQSLILYSKFLPKDSDGVHQKVSRVDNSLISLSSTLPKKLEQHLKYLFESKKMDERSRNEIQALLQSGDAMKVDLGLSRMEECSDCSLDRVVLIMRGIPGSGKTFLIENSVEAKDGTKLTCCSSKQLFHKAGLVTVDQSELNIAEAYCRTCFMDALVNLHPLVVVDGVHSQCWEYAVYRRLARAFGYVCHVLEIGVTEPEDIKLCYQNCVSGVPLEQLVELVSGWEHDPIATVIEPWFNKPTVEHNQSTCLKDVITL